MMRGRSGLATGLWLAVALFIVAPGIPRALARILVHILHAVGSGPVVAVAVVVGWVWAGVLALLLVVVAVTSLPWGRPALRPALRPDGPVIPPPCAITPAAASGTGSVDVTAVDGCVLQLGHVGPHVPGNGCPPWGGWAAADV